MMTAKTASFSIAALVCFMGVLEASPIDDKYVALGGTGGILGAPVSAETTAPDNIGHYRHYQRGSIFWTPQTGAHEIHGLIRERWAQMGWERSGLAYPLTDELPANDNVGRYNLFQNGAIYWSPSTGAHDVQAAIYFRWGGLGWERSALGYPVQDDAATPDNAGHFSRFQNGWIYWSRTTGAKVVTEPIMGKWGGFGWERGFLGYPVSDTQPTRDGVGRSSHFQGGSIYWSPGTGAWEVHGAIRDEWNSLGSEGSPLGYPLGDEGSAHVGLLEYGRISKFQNGYIVSAPLTGVHAIHGLIATRWTQLGREAGFGFPLTDVRVRPDGLRYAHFQQVVSDSQPLRLGGPMKSMSTREQIIRSDDLTRLDVQVFDPPLPYQRPSTESGNFDPCFAEFKVQTGVLNFTLRYDISRVFPEWVDVDTQQQPFVLEGEVFPEPGLEPGPHVAFEDVPHSHDSHDFTFHVRPDPTPDNFSRLGIQIPVDKDGKPLLDKDGKTIRIAQDLIEVEWETGLASEHGPLGDLNEKGISGGFFSAGHKRGDVIWNWPTIGDRVHVEGFWIWDRGHPPAETEIHPPRLVATQRRLPAMIMRYPKVPNAPPLPVLVPALATRVDIFASGDGGALWNNRNAREPYVRRVPMAQKDYTFLASQQLPKPSPRANLRWAVQVQPGDSFPGTLLIEAVPEPNLNVPLAPAPGPPAVRITIPWHSNGVSDSAILARTVYLYWDDDSDWLGVPADYHPRVFKTTLQYLQVRKTHDNFINGADGEYRVFAEAGGRWLSLNEKVPGDHILSGGLGDTGEETFDIFHEFFIFVPPGETFRVHTSGWEADGADKIFGRLTDPSSSCDAAQFFYNNNVFTFSNALSGGKDDPIGEINDLWGPFNGYGLGPRHESRSVGDLFTDDIANTDPNDSYRLFYTIEEMPWPYVSVSFVAPPGA